MEYWLKMGLTLTAKPSLGRQLMSFGRLYCSYIEQSQYNMKHNDLVLQFLVFCFKQANHISKKNKIMKWLVKP